MALYCIATALTHLIIVEDVQKSAPANQYVPLYMLISVKNPFYIVKKTYVEGISRMGGHMD